MSFGFRTEEYYKRFIELQEKLRKSEEERLKLEIKFNEMVRVTREEEQHHYKKLRAQYKRFLEEDRRRQDRNERILRTLERIENRVAMLIAKTERFKLLRQQYQTFLDRIYACNQIKKDIPKESKNDDIVQTYLQNLSSNKLKEMLRKEEDTGARLPVTITTDDLYPRANYANAIADDIINSIYTRSHDDAKQTKEFNNNNTVTIQEPVKCAETKYYSSDDNDKKKISDTETDDFSESEEILYKNPAEFSKVQLRNIGYEDKQRSEEGGGVKNHEESVNEAPTIESKENDGVVKEPFVETPTSVIKDNVILQNVDLKQPVESLKVEENPESLSDSHPIETTQVVKEAKEKQHEDPQQSKENRRDLQQLREKVTTQKEEEQFVTTVSPKRQTQPENQKSKTIEEQPQQQVTTNLEKPTNEPPITTDQIDFTNKEQPAQYSDCDQSRQQYNPETQLHGQVQYYDESKQYSSEQYDEHGQSAEVYDENSQPPQQYDEHAQYLQQYDEHGQVVPQYDEHGQLIQQYDESGYGLEQQYDENGQLIQPQYDESGQLMQNYDANGQLIQPQYDENGQLMQRYDESGQLIQPQYNESGETMQQYNESGQLIQSQYDENVQSMQQYNESGQLIQSQYDENVQSMQQYDENGQLIQPQYNESGETMQQYDDSGQLVQPQYDESEQLMQQYDENGRLLQPQYDDNGQVIQQQYDDQYYPQQYEQSDEQTSQNVAASVDEPEVNEEEEEKAKKPSKVIEMLDTDTESTKQDAKVSNDSDFDFSNG